MITRPLPSCSALAFTLACCFVLGCSCILGCSASSAPPTGSGLSNSNDDGEGGAGGPGQMEPSPGQEPAAATPGEGSSPSPTPTLVDVEGNPIVGEVTTDDEGNPVLVTPDGEEIPLPAMTDDILEGPASGAPGCGDGNLTDDEACDDGNNASSDGCGGDCLTIDPGFSCAVPGEPCRPIARCGDGIVASSEQCDDANLDTGDGCTDRCKIEIGKKCDGSPSICVDSTCGDGRPEGAEACDDGNDQPFDGCSALCLREPDCEGTSCTSDCGDGLVINEDCDDGNSIDGDGCSSTCALEPGFTCVQEATCEKINGECVLRVPTIFRDFPTAHPDFIETAITGGVLLEGSVQAELDAEGRPQLAPGLDPAKTYITSAATFAEWYRDGENRVTLVGDIVLFDNGNGGYVNRFGENGEPFTSVDPDSEEGAGATLAACETTCEARARDGQAPFEGEGNLRCDDICRPLNEEARQLRDNDLIQANNRLTQAENAAEPDEEEIAAIEEEIAAIEAEIEAITAEAEVCQTDCETELAARTEECTAMCAPCSYDPDAYCIGGVVVEWDGNPLFFPVDSIMGPTRDQERAKIPEQYGYNGWPWEDEWFPDAPEHNFFFTSEVQYWFRYENDTNAQLDFTGDDDVWVFINGRLALDLGGIHVPEFGSVTINAQSANRFGLEPGNVYKITVFQAERQMNGSSFKLTLSGFEATPSDCTADCGDGILAFGEECDDGDNDGGYGECAAECKLGEFCGDGIINGPEACDNGPGGGEGCPNCRKLMAR